MRISWGWWGEAMAHSLPKSNHRLYQEIAHKTENEQNTPDRMLTLQTHSKIFKKNAYYCYKIP